ncbi:hypothetical protein P879_05280, partial [Paragonimus westermani]
LPSVGLHGPILKSLCFDQNYLSSLNPLSQSWLPNLQSLSACQNRITEIPELFCPKLEYLSLGDNQISDWGKVNKAVKKLAALKYLNIENNPCLVFLKSKDNIHLFAPSLPSQVEVFLGLQNDQTVQSDNQVCSKSDQNPLHSDENWTKSTAKDSDLILPSIFSDQTADDSDNPSLYVYLHPAHNLPPKKSISYTDTETMSEKPVLLEFHSLSFGCDLLEKLKFSLKANIEQSIADYNIQVPTAYQIQEISWGHSTTQVDEELSVTSEVQRGTRPANVMETKPQEDSSNVLNDVTSFEEDISQPSPTETKCDVQTEAVSQSLTSDNFLNVQECDGHYANPSEEMNEWNEPDWVNSLLVRSTLMLSVSYDRLNIDSSGVIITNTENSIIKTEDNDSMVTSVNRSVSSHSAIPSQGKQDDLIKEWGIEDAVTRRFFFKRARRLKPVRRKYDENDDKRKFLSVLNAQHGKLDEYYIGL